MACRPLLEFTSSCLLPLQQALTDWVSTWTSQVLPVETKEITFERHPLQTLHHLLQRSIQTGNPSALKEALEAVPEPLRNSLFFEVWSQATDPGKGGDRWGELHALENPRRLMDVITTVVGQRWESLPSEKKEAVFTTISQIAQLDLEAIDQEPEKLIQALHRHQCLDIPGKAIGIYSDLERNAINPSGPFDLGRPQLLRGQIRFHNGMNNSAEDVIDHATKLSDLAGGVNLHCTYSATVDLPTDIASAFLGQAGTLTPPVLCLLEGWRDFFESDASSKLLQIGHSRGVIEIYNALNVLPEHLRQRIIVIAAAPAYIIPPTHAYRVVNLVNLLDPVSHIAIGRQNLSSGDTRASDIHDDTLNPHSLHGSHFQSEMAPMLNTYIQTNDIVRVAELA